MILAFLILAADVPAVADDPEETACFEREQSQLGMNRCAAEAYERADAELNRLWRGIIAETNTDDRSPDSGRTEIDQRSGEEILRRAQRAWIQFRDAHCEYEGLSERGGSLEPLVVSQCMTRLTRERINKLSANEK